MCADVGVCGGGGGNKANKALPAFAQQQQQPRSSSRSSSSGSNDMGCPLCMFVVSKVKDSLADPVTRDAIRAQTEAACAALPAGPMRDACAGWARDHEEALFEWVDTAEPADLCAMLGSCALAARLPPAKRALAPMSPAAARALAPLGRALALRTSVVAAAAAAGGDAGSPNGAAPSNDNCETCKDVVAQMHKALADPSLQEQVVDYAKAACDALGSSLADACK